MSSRRRGHVRRRGAGWCIVYDEPTPGRRATGTPRARRRQRWVSGFPTRAAAEVELRRVIATIDDGTYVDPHRKLKYPDALVDAYRVVGPRIW
jgi:hypothetical protein